MGKFDPFSARRKEGLNLLRPFDDNHIIFAAKDTRQAEFHKLSSMAQPVQIEMIKPAICMRQPIAGHFDESRARNFPSETKTNSQTLHKSSFSRTQSSD